MEKLCMVYVTASGKEEAMKIGEELVSIRLAACANVFDGIMSFYRWEGEQQKEQEATLIMKTKESLLPALEKAVKELHSYSCPCIVAIPIIYASKEFADWVARETQYHDPAS